uniref:Uncharacterized protein n=1 Tax=Parascaris univalens TaxID=6257 RepID=A0A915BMB7_PARUN
GWLVVVGALAVPHFLIAMENRYEIQKHMESVVRIALNECKEAFGEETFNENKDWLTHRVWMDLGAMDARMMADLLNCYTDLVNAMREQYSAEIELRKAERKASKMFQQTTAILSELKEKILEKRKNTKPGCSVPETEAPVNQRDAVEEQNVDDIKAGNAEPSKEKEQRTKFDAFDVESVIARAPKLRAEMSRHFVAESKGGGFKVYRDGPTLKNQENRAVVNRHGRAGMHPLEDHHNSKEKLLPRVRMTVSPNGSITECRDGAEQDWEVPWPRPPNFDDEEASSFFTNYPHASSLLGKDNAGDSPCQSSTYFAPSLSQSEEKENWMALPRAPVLQSKAMQDYITHHSDNTSTKKIAEFSLREFDTLAEDLQLWLTREQLNKAIRVLNGAREFKQTII